MRAFALKKASISLVLTLLLVTIAVPTHGMTDDRDNGNPPAKATSAKIDTPAPGLTERERWLLDRVVLLEKRVSELEYNPRGGQCAVFFRRRRYASWRQRRRPRFAGGGVGSGPSQDRRSPQHRHSRQFLLQAQKNRVGRVAGSILSAERGLVRFLCFTSLATPYTAS